MFFTPWLDWWGNQNGSLSASLRGRLQWLTVTFRAQARLHPLLSFACLTRMLVLWEREGKRQERVFLCVCVCVCVLTWYPVSRSFSVFTVPLLSGLMCSKHENYPTSSYLITQPREPQLGHLHPPLAPLRWTTSGVFFFFLLGPVCHTHARAHTHTHTSHVVSVGTCSNAYPRNGGVFELDSCSTSQGLAVCQTFVSLFRQIKHGPLGLWAWLAGFPLVTYQFGEEMGEFVSEWMRTKRIKVFTSPTGGMCIEATNMSI